MKAKHILLTLISLLLLSNCNGSSTPSSSSINQTTSSSSSASSSSLNSNSSNKVTSISSTTSTSNSSITSNSSSKPSSSSSIKSETPWESGRKLLDCGYYQMDLPKNYTSPEQLKTTLSQDTSSWSNNDLKEYLPSGFRYIYRNACDDGPTNHKTSAKFYSNSAGGLKIDNTGVGFQSKMFTHTGEKLEIRIGISQVNNSSDKKEEGKDTFHIYFFNNKGEYLDKYAIEEKTISTSTTELKFYWTKNAKDVAYFELRCNAMPYKGSQCYNVGIAYCNYKSWERA